jgi:hypothetical protein
MEKKMKSLKEDLKSDFYEVERWWIRIPITLFVFFVFSIPCFIIAIIFHAINDPIKWFSFIFESIRGPKKDDENGNGWRLREFTKEEYERFYDGKEHKSTIWIEEMKKS